MPRFVVERTFPTGLAILVNDHGIAALERVNEVNAAAGVTWLHSYVSADHTRTFCIHDAPSPDAIRLVAERNCLPVDRVTPVAVLDAYPYR